MCPFYEKSTFGAVQNTFTSFKAILSKQELYFRGPRVIFPVFRQRIDPRLVKRKLSAPQPALLPVLARGARSPLPTRKRSDWREEKTTGDPHAATRGQAIKCSGQTSTCCLARYRGDAGKPALAERNVQFLVRALTPRTRRTHPDLCFSVL